MASERPIALKNPAAIYATGLLGMGYTDLYIFLIPLYGLSLGMSAGEVGVLVGGRHFLALFLSIHVGVLMDRFGTRRVSLFFVWTAIVLAPVFPLLTAFWPLLLLQIVNGGALSFGWSGSQTLIAFGADSVIELASACVVIRRLAIELSRGEAVAVSFERRAARIGSVLLFALSGSVVMSAGWSLWTHTGQEFSIIGLVLALMAIPLMFGLARMKAHIADLIGSRALRADAAEAIACGYLSAVVVVGLIAQGLIGAWWIDGLSALALTPFLFREALEAWEDDAG